MAAEYNLDDSISKIENSEKMTKIEIAANYNFMLWLCQYSGHLELLETLQNIGDINQLSLYEMVQMSPGVEISPTTKQEMGDLSPDDDHENGMYRRILTQF